MNPLDNLACAYGPITLSPGTAVHLSPGICAPGGCNTSDLTFILESSEPVLKLVGDTLTAVLCPSPTVIACPAPGAAGRVKMTHADGTIAAERAIEIDVVPVTVYAKLDKGTASGSLFFDYSSASNNN